MLRPENITDITAKVAEAIDFDFYPIRASFKSFSLYELFGEIIKTRGREFKGGLPKDEREKMKESVIKQLHDSSDSYNPSVEQIAKEAFYLGNICTTLNHGNIPLPEELMVFGEAAPDLDKMEGWKL